MLESKEQSFESKKSTFFIELGLRAREWLKTHKNLGFLWKGKKEERWENVSKHCLVEAARVEEFADLLKLSRQAKNELFAAAIIHDSNKKEEIEYTTQRNGTVSSFIEVYKITTDKLKAYGIPNTVIELSDSVGFSPLTKIEIILQKPELSEFEIEQLIMNYVDGYTLGDKWVMPLEQTGSEKKNDFDRRMDYNEKNPKYDKIMEEGHFANMRRVVYLIEQRLAELIQQRAGLSINPKSIPEFIDQRIKEKIMAIN